VVFGRVGEPPSKNNVAGLSPKGDDPQMWLMGHSDTGWTDGDLEDKYITARYRVLVSREQYDRTAAYIRQLQAKSTTWSVELYNCNAFVADITKFMGLKAPSSTWIYPKVFVTNMRKVNTGHPEAANELVSENVKEMSNPTRDGRAMIAGGMIHPDGAPKAGAGHLLQTSQSALFEFRTDRRVQLAVHNTRLKPNERHNCSRSVLLFGWCYSLAPAAGCPLLINPPWRLVRQVGSTAAAHRVTTMKSVPSPVSSPRP
jgi:hypothetical protein